MTRKKGNTSSLIIIKFKKMPGKEPVIQNVVSFAQYSMPALNLRLIAGKISGSRFNMKRFPAVIIRKVKPRATLLIFKTGKIILIGSESES